MKSASEMSKKEVIDFLVKCGIWVKDSKIAKADLQRAKVALENMKDDTANIEHGQNPENVEKFDKPQDAVASTGDKEYQDFFSALRKMRWDEIKPEEAKEHWLKFFRAGAVADFYINTLEKMVEAGLEAKKSERESFKRMLEYSKQSKASSVIMTKEIPEGTVELIDGDHEWRIRLPDGTLKGIATKHLKIDQAKKYFIEMPVEKMHS